jgi:hypothetical protein
MTQLDIYVYCFDDIYFNKFNGLMLEHKTCNIHKLSCYHSSNINGLLTENIFYRIFNGNYSCNMVSKNIVNPNPILSIIIHPNKQKVDKSLESFVIMNMHNTPYIKDILGNDYYSIFDHSKICWGNIKTVFYNKYCSSENNDIFHIEENYNMLINHYIPFPHIILTVDEIDNFISTFNIIKYEHTVSEYNKYKKNIPLYSTPNYSASIYNIDKQPVMPDDSKILYTCDCSIGMGDFIQRFERLYKLLNFSDNSFIPIKNEKYSYKNPNHGQGKYLTMYDFPGFDFIQAYDTINDANIIYVQFQTLFEVIMYDKNYFTGFPNDKYLLINLGSYIININNRSVVHKMFNWQNDETIIQEIQVPYSIPSWSLPWQSNNKLLILHFRRGDYVDQLFSNISNPRTMSSFNHLIHQLNLPSQNLDVVIISDHYDTTRISDKNRKYIPILFDYANIKINDTIDVNNIKLIIKDMVIGTDESCNLQVLKYLSLCDYHIGNMSCFPFIMGRIFNKKRINHIRHNNANITCMDDLINLYNSVNKSE